MPIKLRLRAQTEEAQKLGVFGAPSFTTGDGEDVLGQRPAGAGAALGEARRVDARYGSSRIGRPACAMWLLGLRAP